jgi:hypothetical protein
VPRLGDLTPFGPKKKKLIFIIVVAVVVIQERIYRRIRDGIMG